MAFGHCARLEGLSVVVEVKILVIKVLKKLIGCAKVVGCLACFVVSKVFQFIQLVVDLAVARLRIKQVDFALYF